MSTLFIYTDGGARGNPGPAAVGVHVEDETHQTVGEVSAAIGQTTNNEAEYRAFNASLEWLKTFMQTARPAKVEWRLDSMLVVEQLNRRWKLKQPHLKPLFEQAQAQLAELPFPYTISYVPRELNRQADALVNQALDQLG